MVTTSGTAQDWSVVYTGSTGVAGAFEYVQTRGTSTIATGIAQAIRCEATDCTSNNDIVQELQTVIGF